MIKQKAESKKQKAKSKKQKAKSRFLTPPKCGGFGMTVGEKRKAKSEKRKAKSEKRKAKSGSLGFACPMQASSG